jgi:hypothetical protein
MNANNNKLRNACEAAMLALKKAGNSDHAELQSKLEFVIGSYDFDKNPVGLYEFGERALKVLEEIRTNNPKKVTKKVVTDLENSLKS